MAQMKTSKEKFVNRCIVSVSPTIMQAKETCCQAKKKNQHAKNKPPINSFIKSIITYIRGASVQRNTSQPASSPSNDASTAAESASIYSGMFKVC